MKRGLKRALSLALAMLFACFSTVCSAAADVLPFIPFDEAAVSLSVRSEAQSVSRGESFTVEIFVTKNTGFHRLALRRDLGNGLSTTGEVVPGTVTDGETDDLLFVHDDGDTVATGLLASVTVLVGEKAPAGPVTVSFAVDECTDRNGRAVPAEVGSLSVTVAIPVSTITLNETAGELSAGQTVALTASALPDACHATFTWSSSDPTVASVAAKAGDPLSATVTALKPGTAEIRITADNGVNAAYALTVLCPHTNTRVEGASDPGCETPGSTGRLICSDCGEVVREAQPISALGHDWGAVEYVWANDLSTCTATHVCKRDPSHVETENAVITAIVTKAPGYVHYGEHTYSAGFTVPAFITQTRVVADVAPLPVDFVWGDADGSGVVDTADLIRLANYLSGATVEIFPGADANGDDATDEADLARLTAYFADYDFANETPGVILGPDNA